MGFFFMFALVVVICSTCTIILVRRKMKSFHMPKISKSVFCTNKESKEEQNDYEWVEDTLKNRSNYTGLKNRKQERYDRESFIRDIIRQRRDIPKNNSNDEWSREKQHVTIFRE